VDIATETVADAGRGVEVGPLSVTLFSLWLR
jgi:hypothetical protein